MKSEITDEIGLIGAGGLEAASSSIPIRVKPQRMVLRTRGEIIA